MKILRNAEQRRVLLELARVQHQLIAALPVMLNNTDIETAQKHFKRSMDCLLKAARAVDPAGGLDFMADAYDKSRGYITGKIDEIGEGRA